MWIFVRKPICNVLIVNFQLLSFDFQLASLPRGRWEILIYIDVACSCWVKMFLVLYEFPCTMRFLAVDAWYRFITDMQ